MESSCGPPFAPSNLKNRYFCMRHGLSLANRAGLIASNPETGTTRWGLAEGAESAILDSLADSAPAPDTMIFSSPFLRAKETAYLAARALGCGEPEVEHRLKERWFGDYDGTEDTRYTDVWVDDRRNPFNDHGGVESPCAVLQRLTGFIGDLESSINGATVVLISHGDPMDILLTWAAGLPLTEHMDTGLRTAEIRSLISVGASSSTGVKLY